MKLDAIVAAAALTVRAAPQRLDAEVTGGYASDLLSCVLAKAQKGNLWVTLQAHPNVVAVASLLDLAGIVITEGREPAPQTVEKATEQGVCIMTTELATFTIVAKLAELGVSGVD
jgi:BioD-like phosphotransacetylase family protein